MIADVEGKIHVYGTSTGRVIVQPVPEGTPSHVLPPASPCLRAWGPIHRHPFSYTVRVPAVRIVCWNGPISLLLQLASQGGPDIWDEAVHSMTAGSVTSVALSFDSKYLLSAAADGSLAVLDMIDIPGVASDAQDGAVELLPASGDDPVADVEELEKGTPTIEEAKQQAERDALEAAAEAKKRSVKDRVQAVREALDKLIRENEALPPSERLDRSLLAIDPGLEDMVRACGDMAISCSY